MTIGSLEWRAFPATEGCEARSTKSPLRGASDREVSAQILAAVAGCGARLAKMDKKSEPLINVEKTVTPKLL